MSRIEAEKIYLISTEIGNMGLRRQVLSEFDIEDLVRNRAVSQARQVGYMNLGKKIDGNAQFSSLTVPSIFRDNDEDLPEG